MTIFPDPADLQTRLRNHVEALCRFGPRFPGDQGAMNKALNYIDYEFEGMGYAITPQPYDTGDGHKVYNLEMSPPGAPATGRKLVIGAHYDSVPSTPGADDNASAVAMLLELARALASHEAADHILFVAYACEEPPYFRNLDMGSRIHAKSCRERGLEVEMLCLESLGVFTDAPKSQQDPFEVFLGRILPHEGNFVGFESNIASEGLLNRLLGGYQAAGVAVPAVGRALAMDYCSGASDHASYWDEGYPAVMATDTAMLRNKHYHRSTDTPEKLNYPAMASAYEGLLGGVLRAVGFVEGRVPVAAMLAGDLSRFPGTKGDPDFAVAYSDGTVEFRDGYVKGVLDAVPDPSGRYGNAGEAMLAEGYCPVNVPSMGGEIIPLDGNAVERDGEQLLVRALGYSADFPPVGLLPTSTPRRSVESSRPPAGADVAPQSSPA